MTVLLANFVLAVFRKKTLSTDGCPHKVYRRDELYF